MAALSPDGVWIVGYQGRSEYTWIDQIYGYPGNPVVRRWTGSSWQSVSLPGFSSDGVVTGVSGSGPDDVWVNGESDMGLITGNTYKGGKSYAAHFDGTSFTQVTPPVSIVGTGGYRIGGGPGGTWLSTASGQRYVLGNGGWRLFAPPPGFSTITNLYPRSPTDILAVQAESSTYRSIHRWNGAAWSSLDYPTTAVSPAGLLEVAPDELYVWGTDRDSVWHWDGSNWTSRTVPCGLGQLTSDGSDGLWGACYTGVGSTGPIRLVRYTGGTWSTETLPAALGTSVYRLVVIPGTGTVWGLSDTGVLTDG
jgi:hypothetical protein